MPTAPQLTSSCSQRKYNSCFCDWSTLPTDVLADILCRLDDDELVRCKIICKSWNNTVVNICIPSRFASAPLAELICGVKCYAECYTKHVTERPFFNNGKNPISSAVLYDVLPSEKNSLRLCGCYNGLFLYLRRSNQKYYVCNPATRQIVEIPICREVYTRCYVSLAFDPSRSCHFKLVCFLTILRFFKFHVYSSETGRWDVHIIRFNNYRVDHKHVKRTVYVNGILYCLFAPDVLLSIDVDHIKVCSIDLPFSTRDNVIGFIGVSRNHLCYSNRDFFYMFVWRLEGYSDAPKWILMHKILIEHLTSIPSVGRTYRDSKFFMPYALHPTSDVIFVGTPKTIIAYDPHRRELIRKFLTLKASEWLIDGQYKVYLYVRCLVSLKIHKQRDCPTTNLSKYVKHAMFMEELYKGLEAARSNLRKGKEEES